MSQLDRLARQHAEAVRTALAGREPPELDLDVRTSDRRSRSGLAVALFAAAAVIILILPLALITGTPAPDSTVPAISTPSTTPTVTVPESEVETSLPDWQFVDVDIPILDGAGYGTGNGAFYAWTLDRLHMVDLRLGSGAELPVPKSPLEPRSHAALVWTGRSLVVFGGHSGDRSFADGAMMTPSDNFEWQTIPPAPLEPAPYPAVAWTGTEMVVWMADGDSQPGSLPEAGPGQIAAYNPFLQEWRLLDPPPVEVADAVLFSDGAEVTLVGGPAMRSLGVEGGSHRTWAVRLNTSTGEWSEPIGSASPVTDFARAAEGPGESLTVLTRPTVYQVDGNGWHAVGNVHHCPDELAVTSGGGTVYLNGILDYEAAEDLRPFGGCTAYTWEGSLDTMTRIIEWNARGRPETSARSAFIGNESGLLTLGTTENGNTLLGAYAPG